MGGLASSSRVVSSVVDEILVAATGRDGVEGSALRCQADDGSAKRKLRLSRTAVEASELAVDVVAVAVVVVAVVVAVVVPSTLDDNCAKVSTQESVGVGRLTREGPLLLYISCGSVILQSQLLSNTNGPTQMSVSLLCFFPAKSLQGGGPVCFLLGQ